MLMGIREYARHKGVSQAAVSDAIRQGKITEAVKGHAPRRKIDSEIADKLWDERTSQNNSNAHLHGDKGLGSSLHKAKVAKETYQAKLAQLSYDQKAKKLCNVADVRKAAQEIGRITRDKVMGIADKLAPVLAAENDLENIRQILSKELHTALSSLADPQLNFLEDEDE